MAEEKKIKNKTEGKEEPKKQEKKTENKENSVKEDKKTDNKEETKTEGKEEKSNKQNDEKNKNQKKPAKESKEKNKKKKSEVKVSARNLPISTKHSVAVCRFIKNKKIQDAINDLIMVERGKKPVPMKGEIPHQKSLQVQKGERKISSARFPKKAAKNFIAVLNGLMSNAENEGLENPIISVAKANLAHRPITKFGRAQKKRTHLDIIVKEAKTSKQSKNNK